MTRRLLEAVDGIAADLVSMHGYSPEGRYAKQMGEKLHKLVIQLEKNALVNAIVGYRVKQLRKL